MVSSGEQFGLGLFERRGINAWNGAEIVDAMIHKQLGIDG